MGKVVLARIDERLIHGQVMMTLSQMSGVNSIFVVDDVVANDPFMRDLYRSAGGRTGQQTIVVPVERCKFYWDEFEFKEYQCILLTKNVATMYELITHGIPMPELNVGGMAKKSDSDKQVTNSVHLTKEDAIKLKDLRDNYDVNVYFQATPAAPRTNLDEVLAMFDL